MSKQLQRLLVRSFSSSPRVLSLHIHRPRRTLIDIATKFSSLEPITMVTAHDYLTSKMGERVGFDIALVGDSLAMTTLGLQDTNELTLDEFLYHVKSVERGNKESFLVADLPFGSFEKSVEQAVDTSIRLVKEGKVQAVKVEGGNEEILPTITKLVAIGIPVMGHVGLTPQRHNSFGGFKLQGNSVETSLKIYNECLALQKAGVFSIVLECIPNKLSEFITSKLKVPTIGIGAGPSTSGQVLVVADLLGMCEPESHKAKFVKQYSNVFDQGVRGMEEYKREVEERTFPEGAKHGYKMNKEVWEKFSERVS